MRYHWGLGVGHFHAHQARGTDTSSYTAYQPGDTENDQDVEPGIAEGSGNYEGDKSNAEFGDNASEVYQSDTSELGLDKRDLEGWEDVESDGGDLDGDHGSVAEDEEEFGGI
jgi:hypothetical protein